MYGSGFPMLYFPPATAEEIAAIDAAQDAQDAMLAASEKAAALSAWRAANTAPGSAFYPPGWEWTA